MWTKAQIEQTKKQVLEIERLHIRTAEFHVRGTAPFLQTRFYWSRIYAKAPTPWRYLIYRSKDGWEGIPSRTFDNAMMMAADLAGIKRNVVERLIRVQDDDGGLIRITKGQARKYSYQHEHSDRRSLFPLLDTGWEATLRIRYVSSVISAADVKKLMIYAGTAVGMGLNAPLWGQFKVLEDRQ